MMTPSTNPAPKAPARVSLEPNGSRQGMLDGAWWPRSRDPVPELSALIGALTDLIGPVHRIGLNHATWDSHPRRVVARGHVVKLGWYGPNDANAVRIFGSRPHHLDLLLVPPDTAEAPAEAAMATATDATSRVRATDVLTAHGIAPSAPAVSAAPANGAAPEAAEPAAHAATGRRPRTGPLRTASAHDATRKNGNRTNGNQRPERGTADGGKP